MSSIKTDGIIQVGIVVKDIEKSAKMYSDCFGLEMPNIRLAFPNIEFKGTKPTVTARLCSFRIGNITIELIQPGEEMTSWREFMDKHGEGVHHIGFMVEDIQAAYKACEENGLSLRQFGGADWGSYSIMEGNNIGVFFNVKTNEPYKGD